MINDIMIQSFLKLAETQNFTNAARQMFLSQQAVSKHIAKLEEDLACQLFVRDRGNIHLTPAGEIYFEVFSRYNHEMQSAEERVRRLKEGEPKKIVIGYLDLLDFNSILGETIQQFKETYPEITIEYRSATDWELPNLLKDHKIDLSVTFDKEIQDGLPVEAVTLHRVREQLFVSKNHPLAKPDATYLDFKNETVFFSLPPNGNVSHLLQRLEGLGFPYDNLICTENMLSSCTAIDMMQGVSFAIEHSRLMNQGNYATYPTNNEVDILLVRDLSNTRASVQNFLKIARETAKL